MVGCRRQALLSHFGESLAEPCGNCDGCLEPVESWDGTVAAQKALSAILRTGERFGVGHLTDLLRGVGSDKMQRFGHDRLPTFGVGRELDWKAWSSVFRQLVAFGVLEVAHDSYGALRLTEAARPILRGERKLLFRRDGPAGRRKDRTPAPRGLDSEISGAEAALFEALRAERSRLAREQGVPPYVIFHDATLIAVARRRPRNLAELSRVPGIGERKIERYGALLLAVVAEGGEA